MSEQVRLPVTFPSGTEIPVTIAGTVKTEITNQPTVLVGGQPLTVAGKVEVSNIPEVKINGEPVVKLAAASKIEVSNIPEVKINGEPTVKIGSQPIKVEGVATASNVTIESAAGETKLKIEKNRLLVASNWATGIKYKETASVTSFTVTPPVVFKVQSIYLSNNTSIEVKEKEILAVYIEYLYKGTGGRLSFTAPSIENKTTAAYNIKVSAAINVVPSAILIHETYFLTINLTDCIISSEEFGAVGHIYLNNTALAETKFNIQYSYQEGEL